MLFDKNWYLTNNPDVLRFGINPVRHYIAFGAKEGRDPSPLFSTRHYLLDNPDVATSGMNPCAHYILYGAAEGRTSVTNFPARSRTRAARELTSRSYRIVTPKPANSKPSPLVSIIIVNYNGIYHLDDVLSSLSHLNYKNHEIIIVDNASTDSSVAFVESNYHGIKIIKLDKNVGFSEANNIGFELCRGDYIFLLNNDTRCDPDCLSHLVEALDTDPGLGAVGPKIRFWAKFITIEIYVASTETLLLNIDELRMTFPQYPKFFFHEGASESFNHDDKEVRRLSGNVKFSCPADSLYSRVHLHLYSDTASTVIVRIGTEKSIHTLRGEGWEFISIPTDENDTTDPHWIINNAASEVTTHGSVFDRGFSQRDDGTFDVPDEPAALCGCAMLIRREALHENEPIFAANFFAYFEDTDLSLRLRRNGYRLGFRPNSIVYHKHASTSGENSPLFRYYVNRNKILFYALHFSRPFWQHQLAKARAELGHLMARCESNSITREEREFKQKIHGIFADWDHLLPQIAQGSFYDRTRYFQRIAIYNSYWNSKGGGEHHAAVIAEALQTLGLVDLISEREFSISDIEQQFNVDLSGCRKVIITAQQLYNYSDVTSRYDVFINATYRSNLVSHAKNSFYIVSFPYRLAGAQAKRFLRSYCLFLANSNYTNNWCHQFWGVRAETLYPCVGNMPISNQQHKNQLILNVGRFFWNGHNKKQFELVKIFKDLTKNRAIDAGWKLVLAGQIERGHEDYFYAVQNAAEGFQIELRPNISRLELSKLYEQAAIYWHATGLGEDLDNFPDRAEHFGITTIEAMAFGAVPIVIRAGGQPEIVEDGLQGFLFTDADELERRTVFVAEMFDCDPEVFNAFSERARARAKEFSRAQTQSRFLQFVEAKTSKSTSRLSALVS